jgi:hypothetical protein
MRAIVLSEIQRRVIDAAARSLPQSERENFLNALGKRLGSDVSNEALNLAISQVLSVNRIPSFIRNQE